MEDICNLLSYIQLVKINKPASNSCRWEMMLMIVYKLDW